MSDLLKNENLQAVFKKWGKKSHTAQVKESALSGKAKWTSKYGKNPIPIPRLSKNYRTPSQRQKVKHDGYSGYLPSLEIKLSHTTVQITNKCCYRCTPKSHSAWKPESDRKLNLTQVPSARRFGMMKYYFSEICMCSNLEVSDHPDTFEPVISSPEVEEQIVKSYSDEKHSSDYGLSKAKELYSTIAAHSWSGLAKVIGWFLTKILQLSTDGVFVEEKEIDILRQAVDRKLPVLYLPLHKSHLDYVILMWVLCLCDLPSPFVAAGDNLNIPFIGPLLRRLGAFYIRRKPKEDQELYKAIMGQYLVELLKNGSSVEFFVEGRRSRSGLINPTKVGLLSKIVSAVKDGVIGDVLLCPLSITYDKAPEECLTLELQGAKKEPENVFSALWYSLTFPIRQHYGAISVRFSEPFSLSEYVERSVNDIRLHEDTWKNAADMDKAAVFRLSSRLGEHILFNAMETMTVSKLALTSTLVLNTTSWVSQKILEENGLAWREVLTSLKKKPSFSFTRGYLADSIKDLSSCLEHCDQAEVALYKAPLCSTSELLLYYYSAPIVMFSLSISSLCLRIPLLLKQKGESYIVSKSKLMEGAEWICKLLETTIKIHSPCSAVDQQLSYDLDVLYSLGIFKYQHSAISTTDRIRMNKAAATWDDTQNMGTVEPEFYDDSLIVDVDKLDLCQKIGSILLPYLKTLWFVLDYVVLLQDAQYTKGEFILDLCKTGQEDYELGIRPALCTSQCHVTNFVEKLVDLKIVLFDEDSEMVTLSEAYDNTERMMTTVSYLSGFLPDKITIPLIQG